MYNRILIKLSGEALKNNKSEIIDFEYIKDICKKISKLAKNKKIGIVVGGGNIWRGRNNTYIDSVLSDKVGILGTTMNSLIIHSTFDKLSIDSISLNSFEAANIVKKSTKKLIKDSFDLNKIIVFGGGTGNVGCSTDTASAQKAIDMDADLLIKLTNVDGVYDKDPDEFKDAKKYDTVTFDEAISKELKVMDLDSLKLCRDSKIPILVMNIKDLDMISDIINGLKKGTWII